MKKVVYKLIYESMQSKIHSRRMRERCSVTELWKYIDSNCPNSEYPDAEFESKKEFNSILVLLERDHKILVEKDLIYMI